MLRFDSEPEAQIAQDLEQGGEGVPRLHQSTIVRERPTPSNDPVPHSSAPDNIERLEKFVSVSTHDRFPDEPVLIGP